MKAEIVGYQCLVCNQMVPISEIAKHPHEIGQKRRDVHTVSVMSSESLAALPLSTDMEYLDAVKEIEQEAAKGKNRFGAFNSAHEGFAVLLEEVDELRAHVWQKQRSRDLPAMKKEAMQVAAMALRFMIEVCDEERGRR